MNKSFLSTSFGTIVLAIKLSLKRRIVSIRAQQDTRHPYFNSTLLNVGYSQYGSVKVF